MIRNKRLIKFGIFLICGILISAVLSYAFYETGIRLSTHGEAIQQMESIGGSQRTDGPGSYDPDSLNAEGFDSTVPDDFKLILQNDELSFFYKEATAEFALQEKKSSAVFFSNPQDRDSESFAQGSVKKSIAAQLEISYYKSDGTLAVMDSVNHCIEYNNVSTLKEDHSFTVTYKIGKEKVTINDVPQQMSQERFELFLTKLNEDDASDLKSQYALAILNEGDSDKVKANKREKYKNIDNNPVYYLKYDTDRVLTKVKSYFDAAGYTIDDLIFDFEENMIEGEIVEIPTFVIPLEYSLKGTSLVVGLNTADLEYESSMPIHQIKLLQYFHAGNHEDKGYILVPDGSGSLIYFNNGKTNATPFSMKIYGQDHGSKLLQNNQVDEAARLPVFGIRNGGTSVFAQFEEGESLGGIDAYISRMRTSYNNAYFTIYPVRVERVNISENANWAKSSVAMQRKPYEGEFVIRYTPMTADASYSAMAGMYRERLAYSGVLPEDRAGTDLPFQLTLLGGASIQKTFLGVPYDAIEVMTNFEQAADIVELLADRGVVGSDVRFLGWFNNGIAQKYAGNVNILRKLGGYKGVEGLNKVLEDNGGALYPDVFFTNIYATGNGFRKNSDNIRNLNRDISTGYFYNPVNGYRNFNMDAIYKLAPAKIEKTIDSFINDLKGKPLKGISLADLASEVNSDYSLKTPSSRPETQDIIISAQEKLSSSFNIMTASPNAYSFAYSDVITDVSTDDSSFDISSIAVPFLQMILHGNIDYTSSPLNYEIDYNNAFLRNIEFGAGMNYFMTSEDPSLLKYSRYQFYYSGMADEWIDTAAKDYLEASDILSGINDKLIDSHEIISEDLFCTEYENGTKVYVNYGVSDIEYDGVVVPSKGFARR